MTASIFPMNASQEWALFRRIIDRTASEQEIHALEEHLLVDSALRSRYILYMELEASLHQEFVVPIPILPLRKQARKKTDRLRVILVSLVCGLLGFVAGQFFHKQDRQNLRISQKEEISFPSSAFQNFVESTSRKQPEEVAIITYVDDVLSSSGNRFHKGQRLLPGEISISEGELQFDFLNGAQVLVYGPTELQIHSMQFVTLLNGKAAARVPDSARGFVLNAPGAAVVDLGTEFSVTVNQDGVSDIQVTDGEVEVSILGVDGNTVKSERLKDNQAVRVQRGTEELQPLEPQKGEQLTIPLRSLPALSISDEYVRNVKSARPFAYWRFEEMRDRIIPNEMSEEFPLVLYSREQSPPVEVENGVALFRRGRASRYFSVEQGLPGWNSETFTIELWACPQRLHHGALIDILNQNLTGDLNTIEIAMRTPWIHPPGAFRFFHRHPPGQSAYSGLNLFDHDTCAPGEWSHIVAVKTPKSLSFYINGKCVRKIVGEMGSDDDLYQLSIGQMDKKSLLRQYEGALDEIALYRHELTEDVISEHYHMVIGIKNGT